MNKPYCVEINLIKPRITFHFKKRDDKVIDKKSCLSLVTNKIDKEMPKKTEINKMVTTQLHANKAQIKGSLVIPDTSKEALIKKLETKEGVAGIRNQITNRLQSQIRDRLAEKLLKENIDRSINNEWLNDALQLVK